MEAQDRDHLNLRMEKPIVDILKDGTNTIIIYYILIHYYRDACFFM